MKIKEKFQKLNQLPISLKDMNYLKDYLNYSKHYFKKMDQLIKEYEQDDLKDEELFIKNVIDTFKGFKERVNVKDIDY